MSDLTSMLWVEARKAVRSGMPLWTALGALFLPLGLGFLIFVARNAELSHSLGLISAKADLVAYGVTDWEAYLGLFSMFLAAGGLLLFSLVISWTFGREFVDGTVKDLLAVPVARTTILLAKFGVVAAWAAGLTVVMLLVNLLLGVLIQLPGGTPVVVAAGSARVLGTAGLVLVAFLPLAFVAGVGRGYLLPIGVMMLTLLFANLLALAGWADYFPWAVPMLYAQDKLTVAPVSYILVAFTGLVGLLATQRWWKYADQNK